MRTRRRLRVLTLAAAAAIALAAMAAPATAAPLTLTLVHVNDWDRMAGIDGARVTGVTVGGTPLDDGAFYTLATNDFMARGGDGYAVFQAGEMLIDPASGHTDGRPADRSHRRRRHGRARDRGPDHAPGLRAPEQPRPGSAPAQAVRAQVRTGTSTTAATVTTTRPISSAAPRRCSISRRALGPRYQRIAAST